MASQGTRIKGRLVQYTNRGLAQMVKGLGVVRYTQPSTEMTVVWDGGQARLRIIGDAPVLPFGVDVDDVEVLLTVELHWADSDDPDQSRAHSPDVDDVVAQPFARGGILGGPPVHVRILPGEEVRTRRPGGASPLWPG